jgi:heme-degrading monooxygenase HmoA
MIVDNLETPYYAVIFSTIQSENTEGYIEVVQRMEILAKQQKGFLGIESAHSEIGITVSYWQTLADISAWKNNIEHSTVRALGREKWYKNTNYEFVK